MVHRGLKGTTMLLSDHRLKYIALSFLLGASLLCAFGTLQKVVIGAPLVGKGYFVPFGFGGIAGGIIGYYMSVVTEFSLQQTERINTLESLLPICSHCKKIRKPASDPDDQKSWEEVESYISMKTETMFSHGICPECIEKHYTDEHEN